MPLDVGPTRLRVLIFLASVYSWAAAVAEATVPAAGGNSKIVNEFFDKRVPDEETLLTDADFQRDAVTRTEHGGWRDRREIDTPPFEEIDDSAMYNGNRFEGDIVNPGLTSKTLSSFIEDENSVFINGGAETTSLSMETDRPPVMRNAVRQSYLKWPNARIPYTISKQYTASGRQRIADAFREYKERSCVEFTPKTPTDVDYVHILPDEGCYSLVGKVGGKQPVSLGNGCMHKGIIIHELMHAVGFFHEQSRADRDDFIKIKWENVERGLEDQFDKYSLAMIDHLGTKYDYGSVMHYGAAAFSRNGMPTIETIQKGVRIGQRVGFSSTDLYKINKLYACPTNDNTPKSTLVNDVTPLLRTVLYITDTGAAVTILPGVLSGKTPSPPSLPSESPELLPSATPLPTACADLRADCNLLASRGHCESIFSSAYMSANCVRSCERCADVTPTESQQPFGSECRDRRTWCSGWAATGLCDYHVFKSYMHDKCAQSCGLCKK